MLNKLVDIDFAPKTEYHHHKLLNFFKQIQISSMEKADSGAKIICACASVSVTKINLRMRERFWDKNQSAHARAFLEQNFF